MPEFVDSAVREIDARLRELKDEAARLEAARAALAGDRGRRPARRPRSTARRPTTRSSRRRATSTQTRGPRGGNTRANQALELVRQRPGITIPEIAKTMSIQPNYLYRVLPRLADEGQVTRDGQGWRPAGRG